MSANGEILKCLIDEDYGVSGRNRWWRSDDHSSLVLDYNKGIFFFNAQNVVGDPLVYLIKVRGMSLPAARDYLKQFKDYQGTFVYTITNKEQEDVLVYPELVNVFYELGQSADRRGYWYRRGINDLTIDKFKLGWYNDYNTIPIYVDGTFRNFQLRRDKPEKRIKGYYKSVGPLLFNSDILGITNTVYIAEGLTDCLKANQEGIPCVSHNTGAEGWVSEWFKYFIRVKNIFVVFDNDSAGRAGAKRVARQLGIYRTKIFTFAGNEDAYDIVNFFRDGGTKDELINLIDKESKYLFEL